MGSEESLLKNSQSKVLNSDPFFSPLSLLATKLLDLVTCVIFKSPCAKGQINFHTGKQTIKKQP